MNKYIRKELYPIEHILSKSVPTTTRSAESKVDFDGDLINMNSIRYNLFKDKGVTCISCGIEGRYFAKERDPNSDVQPYHFNLYGLDENGNEMLMTKSKIIPKSEGGTEHLSNYDVKCYKCNCLK